VERAAASLDLTELVRTHVDLDALAAGINVDAVVARADVDAVVARADVDAVRTGSAWRPALPRLRRPRRGWSRTGRPSGTRRPGGTGDSN
jgi:hypothetical protein